MPEFKYPNSSSPPSTPDRNTSNGSKHSGAAEPSTTPAGPPPSSAGSFTPAGLPPSSILGNFSYGSPQSSQPLPPLHFSETVFKPPKPQFHGPMSSPSVRPYIRSSRETQRSGLNNEYKAPQVASRPTDSSADLDDDDEVGIDNESDGFEDGSYMNDIESQRAEFTYSDDDIDENPFNSSGLSSRLDIDNFTTQSNSLGRNEDPYRNSLESTIRNSRQEPRREFEFGKIAKDTHNQIGTPEVRKSEYDVVLDTEALVIRLYTEGARAGNGEDALSHALAIIPGELLKLWADYDSKISAHISEEYTATIGPGPRASPFAKANFLANLLLRLYQPHSNHFGNGSSAFLRSSLLRDSLSPANKGKVKEIPLILLEWMDEYHDPYSSQLDEMQKHKPSPAHHPLFWNTILNSLLRGRVLAVVNTLKTAGWRYARNSSDDSGNAGYAGVALKNIETVIGDAIQVMQQCPAIRGDWDTRGGDWTLFRLKIQKENESLRIFAEGVVQTRHESSEAKSSGKVSLSAQEYYSGIAKKAESRVPWDIYQNLTTMYNLILGDLDSIVESSQDWCEATIGLVVWWNPSKDDRRLTLKRSRSSTETDSEIYIRKITDSFYRATNETTELLVNTNNPVEVGLACLFEGDIESVIAILSSWSGPISTAVVEIASLGGWLPQKESQALGPMDDLDQDDMDLLGITSRSENSDSFKDHALIAYATALAQCVQLESNAGFGRQKINRHGWELAIEIFGRLDSAKRSEEEVGNLIHTLPLDSGAIIDKLWRLLNNLGMTAHAENTAEVS